MSGYSQTLITSNSCISYWSRLGCPEGTNFLDFNYFSNDKTINRYTEVFVFIEFESLMSESASNEKLVLYLSNLGKVIERNRQINFVLMPWFPSNLDVFTWEATQVEVSRIRRNADARNKILELVTAHSNTVYLDLEFVLDKLGRQKSESEIGWRIASCRLSNEASTLVVKKIEQFKATDFGEAKKVLLLDFDNTIWGGVIGEDEYESIQIDKNGEGFGYYSFQSEILQLIEKGVLVCGVTKNNYSDVVDFFSKKNMPLKLSSFTSIYANWDPKHLNIRKISIDFNLPTSSMVFIDDSEFERYQAQQNIPDLTILAPPNVESKMTHWISSEISPIYFPRKRLTNEDMIRQESYKRRSKYEKIQPENIKSVVKLHLNSDTTLDRISQMSEKTNQFNLRKKRYTLEELRAFVSVAENLLVAFEYSDQFGTEGIVGYVMLSDQGPILFIESFVMSCRVIGRNLEKIMLKFVIEEAKRRGSVEIATEPFETGRNQICLDYFKEANFFSVQNNRVWMKNVE